MEILLPFIGPVGIFIWSAYILARKSGNAAQARRRIGWLGLAWLAASGFAFCVLLPLFESQDGGSVLALIMAFLVTGLVNFVIVVKPWQP